MPSLERFFNPQMRVFSANITSMPSARLYFFEAGSTTPKVTYADKQGTIPNANPVIADATGSFPDIFLDGLYRAELRSSGNIVQPGWPKDNVGQDTPLVPYANWRETVTYDQFERVTDPITGIVYRSLADNNLGNIPASSPSDWEVIIDPVPSSFTSDASYISWSDDGGQISLDVDQSELNAAVAEGLVNIPNTLELDSGKIQIGVDSGSKLFINNLGQASIDDVTYYEIFTSRNFPIVKTSLRTTAINKVTNVTSIDPDLSISALTAGWYEVEVYLHFTTEGSNTNGIYAEVVKTDGSAFGFPATAGVWEHIESGVTSADSYNGYLSTSVLVYPSSTSANNSLKFKGMVNNSAGTGICVTWAQGTLTPANATRVQCGYIKATRLLDL